MTKVNNASACFTVEAGKGKYRLTALVAPAGEDLVVSITGGDKPHVGAVAAAHCAPGVNRKDRLDVSASVITLPGHKEDEIARTVAMKLAKEFSVNVAVAAGMHWDGITKQGIATVIENSRLLCEAIILRLKQL